MLCSMLKAQLQADFVPDNEIDPIDDDIVNVPETPWHMLPSAFNNYVYFKAHL